MEIRLSDDQQLFVETTRRFLAAESPLSAVRALVDDPVGYDRAFWRRGADLGWTSLLADEAHGGGSVSGAGLADLVLVAEEMGRAVAPGPLVGVNVVVSALSRAGAAGAQADVLADLLSGAAVATWALAESDRAWDAEGVALRASPSGDGWVVSGTKAYVADAGSADWLLVTARTGDALSQLLVPADAPGVAVEPLVSLDMVRRYAHVELRDVALPAWALVGEAGGAGGEVEHQLQQALVLQCAGMVGAADAVFGLTMGYVMDRVSFGRPVGSYQAIKHRLADMKLWLEACHGTASAAARAVHDGAANAPELVSVAKAYIADRAPALIQDCVQLHGGIGVTWDADLHLYLRRVAQDAALLGTVSQHRERLARLLGM